MPEFDLCNDHLPGAPMITAAIRMPPDGCCCCDRDDDERRPTILLVEPTAAVADFTALAPTRIAPVCIAG